MTKGRTSMVVAAMVLMGVLAAGCGGKKNDVAADGQVDRGTHAEQSTAEQTIAESAETVEETTVEQTAAEQTTEASTEETAVAATETETTKAAPTTERVQSKKETKAETKAEAPKAPAQAAPAPAQAAPAPAPTEPVHEHVWKEHTATRDEWVPNVVTVTETKKVEVGYNIVCNCGEKFFMGEGFDPHNTAHLLAGEPDNYHSEAAYEERTETHEEDQGYYQTIEYVDYYYCECGATK